MNQPLEVIKAEADLLKMRKSRAVLASRKMELQGELSNLNREVRGKRIESWRYAQVCARQTQISDEMHGLDRELISLRSQIDELSTRKELVKAEAKTIAVEQKSDTVLMVDLLAALAKKYQDHASDSTRVSSTRVMASQFAEEIRDVIRAGAK